MALNIQTLVEAIQAKLAAADSSMSSADQLKLISLRDNYNASSGVLEYRSRGHLPTADSSQYGHLVYTTDTGLDTRGRFYVGTSSGWGHLTAGADSDENASAGAGAEINALLQGTSYGYVAGGFYQPAAPNSTNVIQKYSYTSNGNSVSVGTIANTWWNNFGATSVLAGYVFGGDGSPVGPLGAVDKFPFATDTSSGLTLDLSSIGRPKNQVMSSNLGAFMAGTKNPAPINTENIIRFSFANDGVTEQVGVVSDGTVELDLAGGSSSSTHGYMTGGRYLPANTYITAIRRFPFATTTTVEVMGAVMVNNAAQGRATQSTTHGYQFGGSSPAVSTSSSIQKFSFASDTNAVQIGTMFTALFIQSTSASTTKAYSAGGMNGSAINSNVIQSVPFATDTNASDVGDLLTVLRAASGHQY